MEIFIGSSTQKKPTMNRIAMWVEDKKHKPMPWNGEGVFPPGTYTFQRLVEITKIVQGAIFVFGEDDEQWYRNDTTKVTRDNILIEYGLFTGALGMKSVIICREGNPKSPSDLHGITYVDVSDGSQAHAKVVIENWLDSLSPVSQPLVHTNTPAQSTSQLFDKRAKLGSDEITVLNLLILFGKQNEFAMTYDDINRRYTESGNADIPLTKLIKRGFLQIEPGKIKACSITKSAWEWIKQADDLIK